MTNEKWGKKRQCLVCNKRFYDLKREPPVCPYCGGALSDSPRAKTAAKKSNTAAAKAALNKGASANKAKEDDKNTDAPEDSAPEDSTIDTPNDTTQEITPQEILKDKASGDE